MTEENWYNRITSFLSDTWFTTVLRHAGSGSNPDLRWRLKSIKILYKYFIHLRKCSPYLLGRLVGCLFVWLIDWLIAVFTENITMCACNHNWTWKGKEENYPELKYISTTRLTQQHGDTVFFRTLLFTLLYVGSRCYKARINYFRGNPCGSKSGTILRVMLLDFFNDLWYWFNRSSKNVATNLQ
jgi:hypothetical protein